MIEKNDMLLSISKLNYLIGRDEICDIFLNNSFVSSMHAQINMLGNNMVEIEDLSSLHGTFINGRPIKRSLLQDKDRIRIGIFEMIFNFSDEKFYLCFPKKKTESKFVAEFDLKIRSEILIGRGANSNIILDNAQISRNHSKIEYINNQVIISDLGSTNGTIVNDKKISKKVLKDSDLIRVGPIRFLYLNLKIFQLNDKDVARLDVYDISKSFYDTSILNNITLSIFPREFVGIIGPSGSGKSTLMKLLCGSYTPTKGEVFINNVDLHKNISSFKSLIGLVPQEDIIHEELTVEKTLKYAADLRLPDEMSKEHKQKRIEQIINVLELEERRSLSIKNLSGGQKKRVNLGVELLTEPSLLFLDEPTSGLDAGLEQKMMQLFRRLADGGETVVLTTHNLSHLDLLDLIIIVFDGDLVFFGPPNKLLSYFKIKSVHDVYNRLNYPPEGGWVKKYRNSILYKDYINQRLKEGKKSEEEQETLKNEESIHFLPKFSMIKQFKVLSLRYLEIMLKDKDNVLILLGQAPVIALFFILVFFNYKNEYTLAFCLSLSAIWFGAINSIKEITKETHIFSRERTINLRITSYVFSKLVVLGVLCVFQCLMLLALVRTFIPMEGSSLAMYLVLLLSSFAGLAMGLMVSALARTTDRALALLPIILIPQIVFSGTVVQIDNMIFLSKRVADLMICRWSYDILKSITIWNGSIFTGYELYALIMFIPVFVVITLISQKRKDKRL